jgi:hypothetical protein
MPLNEHDDVNSKHTQLIDNCRNGKAKGVDANLYAAMVKWRSSYIFGWVTHRMTPVHKDRQINLPVEQCVSYVGPLELLRGAHRTRSGSRVVLQSIGDEGFLV